QPTPDHGRVLVERVCGYLGVNPAGVEIRFAPGGRPPPWLEIQGGDAAGMYEDVGWSKRVLLDGSTLDDPVTLVATAAHELAHLVLGGFGAGEEEDHEELTDLATVALGFGVFTANSRVRSRAGHSVGMETWSIRKLGYLGQPE